jgi:hypothetical protein bfra3_07632
MVLFLGTGCVKDGANDNCNNWLRIVYDYNMERKDLFDVQGKFFTIFVFDSATGLFEQEINMQGPFAEKFTVDVPQSLYGKKYDYVVWAGLNPDSYSFIEAQKGVTRIEDIKVQVKGYQAQLVDQDLEPLWHGMITEVQFDETTEKTEIISLTKDTKTFRILFQFFDKAGAPIQPYDLSELGVSIETYCGWYAYDNSVLDARDRVIKHIPYVTDHEGKALVYEMNTTRLMDDRQTTLVVRNNIHDEELFRMPLNEYLNLLRLLEESWVKSLQEYFDREDDYRIIITNNSFPEVGWASFKVQINGWTVREHNSSDD